MMVLFITFISLLASGNEAHELDKVRLEFLFEKPSKEQLIKWIDEEQDGPIIEQAYQGLSMTLMAEHVFSPLNKLSYFQDGKELIEKCIKENPNNPELRYIRLIVQLNAPYFLGYNDNIENDLKIFTTMIEQDLLQTNQMAKNILNTKHIDDFYKWKKTLKLFTND
ncbi:MAG: hypothetical protein JXR07_00115 [Reichenbachiella sp.]